VTSVKFACSEKEPEWRLFREQRGNIDCYLRHLLRTKHQSDDACYAVSENVIFLINYHSDIPHLEKIYCGKKIKAIPVTGRECP
jgi:hypothetical protein